MGTNLTLMDGTVSVIFSDTRTTKEEQTMDLDVRLDDMDQVKLFWKTGRETRKGMENGLTALEAVRNFPAIITRDKEDVLHLGVYTEFYPAITIKEIKNSISEFSPTTNNVLFNGINNDVEDGWHILSVRYEQRCFNFYLRSITIGD